MCDGMEGWNHPLSIFFNITIFKVNWKIKNSSVLKPNYNFWKLMEPTLSAFQSSIKYDYNKYTLLFVSVGVVALSVEE